MPNPTTRLQFPGGKFVDVPGALSQDEVQAYLSKHPALGGFKVQEGAPSAPPAAAPSAPKPPDHKQGWGEWAAEQAPMIGGILGGAAAGLAELGSFGMATPLAIALPTAGSVAGEGVRDYFRHKRGDSRASKSVGEELKNMAVTGVTEGTLNAVVPGAAKVLPGVGRWAKQKAVNLAVGAIEPGLRQLAKAPGAATNGTLAVADQVGHMVLDNGIHATKKGAGLTQSVVDTIEQMRGGATAAHAAAPNARLSDPIHAILDRAANADGYKYVEAFANQATPQASQRALAQLEKDLLDPENTNTMMQLAQQGGVPPRFVRRPLNAAELQKMTSATASANQQIFEGGMPDALNTAVDKLKYTGLRNELNHMMSGWRAPLKGAAGNTAIQDLPAIAGRSFEDLGRQENTLLLIKKALSKGLTADELVGIGTLPSAFLAYSHPLLAGTGMVLKSPGVVRGIKDTAAHRVMNPASKLVGWAGQQAAQHGNAIPQALRGMRLAGGTLGGSEDPNPSSPEQAALDALYNEFRQQNQ